MPDFIVTQTAKEYSDFKKKTSKKELKRFLLLLVLTVLTCSFVWYALYLSVHP